eukprot:6212714-Pleurochrysis_carterae.AAC.1
MLLRKCARALTACSRACYCERVRMARVLLRMRALKSVQKWRVGHLLDNETMLMVPAGVLLGQGL